MEAVSYCVAIENGEVIYAGKDKPGMVIRCANPRQVELKQGLTREQMHQVAGTVTPENS